MANQLETTRLILRPWVDEDFEPFYRLNSDDKVMQYFPHTLSQEESNSLAQRLSHFIDTNGWGCWAVEEKLSKNFIGFVGLAIPNASLNFKDNIEIGWRLAVQYWHKGYATEAAQRALSFGFNELRKDEIISFTASINTPSQNVMKRIGMTHHNERFMHPLVTANHPLQEHVLYRLCKQEWLTNQHTI